VENLPSTPFHPSSTAGYAQISLNSPCRFSNRVNTIHLNNPTVLLPINILPQQRNDFA